MTMPSRFHRFAVRLSYCLPLILAVLFLISSLVPHLFFLYGAEAQETLSLFELMGNAVRTSHKFLSGEAEGDPATLAFSRAVMFYFVVSVLGLVIYGITALLETCFSSYALSLPPTHDAANQAKRWFRFLCPNRILLQLSHLLLLFPLLFPQVLQYLYRQYLAIDAQPNYLGLHDLWVFGLLLLLEGVLLFATIPWQKAAHMDMYQLYRRRTPAERDR